MEIVGSPHLFVRSGATDVDAPMVQDVEEERHLPAVHDLPTRIEARCICGEEDGLRFVFAKQGSSDFLIGSERDRLITFDQQSEIAQGFRVVGDACGGWGRAVAGGADFCSGGGEERSSTTPMKKKTPIPTMTAMKAASCGHIGKGMR